MNKLKIFKKLIYPAALMVFTLLVTLTSGCFEDDKSATPSVPTKIYLYSEGTLRNGNLVSRSNADALCSASTNKPSGVTTAHAFISFSASDSIAIMPATYNFSATLPVYGPNGTSKIGDNWADLLDSSIPDTLQNLGVISTGFWTGSNADGTVHANNCTGWTDGTSAVGGSYGIPTSTDGTFLRSNTHACDNTAKPILCIGY